MPFPLVRVYACRSPLLTVQSVDILSTDFPVIINLLQPEKSCLSSVWQIFFSFLLCVSVHCACLCVEGHTCLQMCPCMGAMASGISQAPSTLSVETRSLITLELT